MAMRPAQWHKQLAQSELAPVHLLAGEELLVLEAADALRARARELGFDEREVLEAHPQFDWNELARAGAGMSLFATHRLIDLRLPTGRPGREGSAAIKAWCEDPPPDTLLLITATEWSKKHEAAWSRAVDSAGAMVVFWPPRAHEWHDWIAARLSARRIQASNEAVALLAERVEGNLLAAAQEVDKLAALHGEGRLDATTLESLVADSTRFDVFKLTDAAFGGDAARAVRIVEGLAAEGDEVIALMGWLVNQLQVMLRLATARDFATQARAEHLWPARQRLLRGALQRASAAHWRRCLQRAGRIDRMAKGRAGGDPWREAQRLVAAMADPRGTEPLA